MAHTVANVPIAGRAYTIEGADKKTVTDVTVTTNSETVTAASLGLNCIYNARADVHTGVSTDTGTYSKATVASTGASITLAEFAAAGTAAVVNAAGGTVIRVHASGY